MSTTAKVTLVSKALVAKSDPEHPDQYQLVFQADYADGANSEWALYTPSLSLSMVVVAAVADLMELGSYDLALSATGLAPDGPLGEPTDTSEGDEIDPPADEDPATNPEVAGPAKSRK